MYHSRLVSVLLVSLVLSLCTGAAIYPKSLTAQKGSNSDVSITALQKQDQSGSQDSWSKYVEFYGSNSVYQGIFIFDASTIDASSVSAYSLNMNFRGPSSDEQVWKFEFLQPATNTWVAAADNSNANSWAWTSLTFAGSVEFASIVSNGQVQVRLSSALGDDCDIDYLAIVTVAGSSSSSASSSSSEAPATEAPTQAPATVPPTNAPATVAPTNAPAPKHQKSTKAPTVAPTPKPTKKPTSAPVPTVGAPAPTSKATVAPVPTVGAPAPTSKATVAPVPTVGASSPPGRMCSSDSYWAPAPATTWQWQLTGTIDQSLDVQMYDIDLFDNTAATIASLHAAGRVVICYFSTQYENWRPDSAKFTPAVIGAPLDNWPGENYVDIRSSVVRSIMQERLDLAVSKGCDGVEPDNVDEYTNTNGLGITAADQLDFNKFIATEAHARGLSVGLKNDIDQASALVSYFDWALDEQCNQYSECSSLTPFITAGKAVFGVEYSGSASKFCPTMVNDKMSWLLKDLNLDAKVTQCCTYATGGCATKAAYQCKSVPSSKRSIVDEEAVIVDEIVAEAPELVYEEFNSAASATIPVVAVALVSAVVLLL